MSTPDDLQRLSADLQACLAEADRLGLGMAGIYISHALEHVSFVESATPKPPPLRSINGGKDDS